jgi:hypothetical protein
MQTTATELSAPWQSSKLELATHGPAWRHPQRWRQPARQRSITGFGKLELEAHGPAQRHSQQWRQPALQRSPTRTGTAHHWLAQRHSGSEDNRPVEARLQHVRLGLSPDAWQQPKACATRMHALSGLCIRGATAFVHRIGPATLSDISLRQRQPARRRPSQAHC